MKDEETTKRNDNTTKRNGGECVCVCLTAAVDLDYTEKETKHTTQTTPSHTMDRSGMIARNPCSS